MHTLDHVPYSPAIKLLYDIIMVLKDRACRCLAVPFDPPEIRKTASREVDIYHLSVSSLHVKALLQHFLNVSVRHLSRSSVPLGQGYGMPALEGPLEGRTHGCRILKVHRHIVAVIYTGQDYVGLMRHHTEPSHPHAVSRHTRAGVGLNSRDRKVMRVHIYRLP